MPERSARFDPYAVFRALDAHGVQYVLIGGLARVLQGTEELTRGTDIVPSTRGDNLRRLDAALRELGATHADGHRSTWPLWRRSTKARSSSPLTTAR